MVTAPTLHHQSYGVCVRVVCVCACVCYYVFCTRVLVCYGCSCADTAAGLLGVAIDTKCSQPLTQRDMQSQIMMIDSFHK